jgi:putative ABC transport system substrate-binding protein
MCSSQQLPATRLPVMGATDLFPRAGSLISYGFDLINQYVQAASYIDRILKGASPGDLPVQQPTKYSLIINLRTARALTSPFPRACSTSPTRSSNSAG